jgi:hypothetical protein
MIFAHEQPTIESLRKNGTDENQFLTEWIDRKSGQKKFCLAKRLKIANRKLTIHKPGGDVVEVAITSIDFLHIETITPRWGCTTFTIH